MKFRKMETQKQGQRPREFTRWCRALAGTQPLLRLRQQAGQFRAGKVSPQESGGDQRGEAPTSIYRDVWFPWNI